MTTKPATDWEAIEREYRADQLSNREIGKAFGVSHVAIGNRAKKHGWVKDLGKQVRTGIQNKLMADEVTSGNTQDAVNTAVERGAQVIKTHRRDIERARNLVGLLVDELAQETIDAAELRNAAGNTKGKTDKRLLHALSLPARAAAARQLAGAQKDLIGLERNAFNLDDKKSDDLPEDRLPLEERLKAYRQEDQINKSDNVARLPTASKRTA